MHTEDTEVKIGKACQRTKTGKSKMNHLINTTNGDSVLHYKGFPTIKVGHFYKLQTNGSRVVAYCSSEDRFVIKTGSAVNLVGHRMVFDPGYHEEEYERVSDDWGVLNCVERIDRTSENEIVFTKDYDGANPSELAQAILDRGDVNPEELWIEVFCQ